MKLKFKKQDFQERAVNAVADLFKEGRKRRMRLFSIADNSAQMNFLQNEFGFGNKLLLDKKKRLFLICKMCKKPVFAANRSRY